MIERIIENWLDKSSERSYQLPFCYMLIQQGKTILHLTRHTAMEHGKDIIARDEEGNIYAYQLKGVSGGKLKLREWQQILPQIIQMIYTPVTHPSAASRQQHISYLVLNGEIEEEVFNAIYAFNTDRREKGQPEYQINTVVRGEILQWAYSIKDQLVPTELKEVKSLLEFYLHSGEGFLDKLAFCRLVRAVLHKPPNSQQETKRLISSAAVLCSVALSQYEEKKNYVAVIEGWAIYMANVLSFAEEFSIPQGSYREEILLADKIIKTQLQELSDECLLSPDLITGDMGTDLFVFKHRITVLFGFTAYFGQRIYDDIELRQEYVEKLNGFYDKHKPFMDLWGEGAVPFLVNLYWFYKKAGATADAIEILKHLFDKCITEFKLGRNSVFTNYYLSAEESILLIMDEKTEKRAIEMVTDTRHVLEQLLHLLVENACKLTPLPQRHIVPVGHFKLTPLYRLKLTPL